jgi:hypothetical protein
VIVIETYSAYFAKPIRRAFDKRPRARDEWSDHELRGALPVTEQEMRKRLEALRIEHRDLDAAIEALSASGSSDQLQIARLKKRKLLLKDQIAILEDYLIPDIIA